MTKHSTPKHRVIFRAILETLRSSRHVEVESLDKFSKEKRSAIMASIGSSDTAQERYVKRALWAAGFRYARSCHSLPGSPDVVLPSLKAVVFVHGCFWHGHLCSRGKLPASNHAFWETKIAGNLRRDRRVLGTLRRSGWHCFQIWQCRLRVDTDRVIRRLLELRAG